MIKFNRIMKFKIIIKFNHQQKFKLDKLIVLLNGPKEPMHVYVIGTCPFAVILRPKLLWGIFVFDIMLEKCS